VPTRSHRLVCAYDVTLLLLIRRLINHKYSYTLLQYNFIAIIIPATITVRRLILTNRTGEPEYCYVGRNEALALSQTLVYTARSHTQYVHNTVLECIARCVCYVAKSKFPAKPQRPLISVFLVLS